MAAFAARMSRRRRAEAHAVVGGVSVAAPCARAVCERATLVRCVKAEV